MHIWIKRSFDEFPISQIVKLYSNVISSISFFICSTYVLKHKEIEEVFFFFFLESNWRDEHKWSSRKWGWAMATVWKIKEFFLCQIPLPANTAIPIKMQFLIPGVGLEIQESHYSFQEMLKLCSTWIQL